MKSGNTKGGGAHALQTSEKILVYIPWGNQRRIRSVLLATAYSCTQSPMHYHRR